MIFMFCNEFCDQFESMLKWICGLAFEFIDL